MKKKAQIKKIILAGFLMLGGIIFLKFLPMLVWGSDITFDASLHIATAVFVIYVAWFFVDQNEGWHLPFFALSTVALFVIATQRILVNAHNDVGILLGMLISLGAIAYVERYNLKGKLKF